MSNDLELTSTVSNQGKLTPTELKIINRKKVYDYVYQTRKTAKQDIARALDLSLPTVTQHLSSFLETGLIEKRGEYESTGGRKAQIIRCNATARISVGVEILKESVQIIAIDLYGNTLKENFIPVTFRNEDSYYKQLGDWINTFADSLPYPAQNILGVCIAIQGLISPDGNTISFSEILHCTGVKLQTYQQYINLPCHLIHDTEAAALAELKDNSDLNNAIYLSLNRAFGGAIILNKQVLHGKELSGGIIEHMCISLNGPTCYCGKQGCIETFCSANALKHSANMELDEFFKLAHANVPRCTKIWRNYLHYLAVAIDNIRMILDYDLILGGYLIQFMNESDIALLTRYVKEQCAFDTSTFSFRISKLGSKAAVRGAALTLVERFLQSI